MTQNENIESFKHNDVIDLKLKKHDKVKTTTCETNIDIGDPKSKN